MYITRPLQRVTMVIVSLNRLSAVRSRERATFLEMRYTCESSFD